MKQSLLAQNIDFSTITTPGGYQPGDSTDGSSQAGAVEGLISNTLVVLTVVAGLAFVLYFLLGGLNWVTAGGDKTKIDKAKGMMTGGATGLIIIVLSYSIVWIVSAALGLNILEPGTVLQGLTFN